MVGRAETTTDSETGNPWVDYLDTRSEGAFADGHSEIHAARDGDFESWERPRLMPPPAPRE